MSDFCVVSNDIAIEAEKVNTVNSDKFMRIFEKVIDEDIKFELGFVGNDGEISEDNLIEEIENAIDLAMKSAIKSTFRKYSIEY
jgi:hypothetical protein